MANQTHCDKCKAETDRVFGGIGIPDGECWCRGCVEDAGLERSYSQLIHYHVVDNDETRRKIIELQDRKKLEKRAKWIEQKRGPEAAAKHLKEHHRYELDNG